MWRPKFWFSWCKPCRHASIHSPHYPAEQKDGATVAAKVARSYCKWLCSDVRATSVKASLGTRRAFVLWSGKNNYIYMAAVKYLQVKVPSLDPWQTSVGSGCIWGLCDQETRGASCFSQWEGWRGLTAVPATHWFTVKADLPRTISTHRDRAPERTIPSKQVHVCAAATSHSMRAACANPRSVTHE